MKSWKLLVAMALFTVAIGCNRVENDADGYPVYKVTIDDPKSLLEMIADADFDSVSDDVRHFRRFHGYVSSARRWLSILEWPGGIFYGTTEEVKKEIADRGFHPAEIEELIAFADEYPEEIGEFPVAALGSCVVESVTVTYCPIVYKYKGFLYLDAEMFLTDLNDDRWCKHTRFLAIRE